MSWSVYLNGKSDEIAKEAAKQFAQADTYLIEPEKTIAQKASALVAEALAGQQPPANVKLEAHGSMSKQSNPDTITNSVTVKLELIY